MKFATYKNDSGQFIGIVNAEGTHVLPFREAYEKMGGETAIPADMLEAISMGKIFYHEAEKTVQWVSEKDRKSVV